MAYLEDNTAFQEAVVEASSSTVVSYSMWHEAAAWTLRMGPLLFERCPDLTSTYDNVWLTICSPNLISNRTDKVGNQTYRAPLYPHASGLMSRNVPLQMGWNAPVLSFNIMPSPAFIAQCANEIGQGDPNRSRFQYTFRFEDPLVTQLCLALYHEQHADALGGSVYAGALLHTLTTRLLLTASPLRLQPSLPTLRTNGLTPHEVRTIQAYIDGNLDQALTLPDLAGTLQMSVAQFRRRFKHTLHMPPHQYLIQRRVERATALLQSGVYSIAQVAHAVGFTDQSHLCRHCRRILGVKPSDVLPSDQNVQEFDQNVQDRTAGSR